VVNWKGNGSPDLSAACGEILAAIRRLGATLERPVLIALDGGSGAGKSALASSIAAEIDVALVPLDDFFAAHIPDVGWDARSVAERARDVFDWRRVRAEALEPLLAGRPARWHAFDFQAGPRADGTYGMCADWVERAPAQVILLDGAYSAGPQLADLVDLAVLVDVPIDERHARLAAREGKGFLERWHARWDAVEARYFAQVRPPASFDLVVSGSLKWTGGPS
jgi:uridine kinase